MQKWDKLGLVFCPDRHADWMQTHAAVPSPIHLHDDVYRIYFGTRNVNNEASVSYCEIDLKQPNKILKLAEQPVLGKGPLGGFDDSGTLPSWIAKHDNKYYMYYVAWNLGVTVPFRNFLGLAISEDNGLTFNKYSRAPIIDRDDIDPFFFTNPCVFIDGDIWRMYYLSCTEWVMENDKPKHYYHLKYAESKDGIHWDRDGTVAIDYEYDNEYAISRPSTLKDGDTYKIWFSFRGGPRGETYRIGYGESKDGKVFKRNDEAVGLDISEDGWDKDMVCYPCVFDHDGKRYMLYNGNGYGRSGFGLAVLDQD